MARSKQTVLDAVESMRESAAANDGKPNMKAVARATGISRTTLRRWWAAAASTPVSTPVSTPASSSTPDELEAVNMELARQLISMPGKDADVEILARAIQERNRTTSETARARLTVEVTKLSRELRPPEVEEDLADLPLEERLERLQMAVAEWPDDYLEVALRIYGERHKGRILLVTDQGRARLEEAGWSQEATAIESS